MDAILHQRAEKVHDAYAHCLDWHSDSPITFVELEHLPANTGQFGEVPRIDIPGNELSDAQPLLHWHAFDFPILNEMERLKHFLSSADPNAEQEKLFVGVDEHRQDVRQRKPHPGDPSAFLTKNHIRIPFKLACHPLTQSITLEAKLKEDLSHISTMNPEEILKILEFLEQKLVSIDAAIIKQRDQSGPWRLMVKVLGVFGMNPNQGLDFQELKGVYTALNFTFMKARTRCIQLKREDLKNRYMRLNDKYITAYRILFYYRKFYSESKLNALEDLQDSVLKDAPELPNFTDSTLDLLGKDNELKKMHCLILYYLEIAETRGYRKAGHMVYKPKRLANGQLTFEYVEHGDMDAFINEGMGDMENQKIFQWLFDGANIWKQLQSHLIFLQTSRFPNLNKNRNSFGFNKGIYNTQFDRFIYWDEINNLPFKEHGIAVAKHHDDVEFRNEIYELLLAKAGGDWYALPTPFLFKLFDAQGFKEDVKRFLCVCGGRMLQRLGTDNWQFILWCIGKSGTGKSTFANFFSDLFAREDVGTLSQIIEKQFGMQHFFDPKPKLLVVAPDLSKGIGLPLPIFLNWISAESICVPRKNNTAIERDLDIPFIAASNILALHDIREALARRVAFLKFDKTIKKSDTRLLHSITTYELPIILKKFTLAYWEAFQKHAHQDIWDWIPPYFKRTREEMASESNSIRNFLLNSGLVIIPERDLKGVHNFDTLMCTPVDRLGGVYKTWIQGNYSKADQVHTLSWSESNWKPIFEELNCTTFRYTGYWPPRNNIVKHDTFTNHLFVANCVTKEASEDFKTNREAEKNPSLTSSTSSSSSQPAVAPVIQDEEEEEKGFSGLDFQASQQERQLRRLNTYKGKRKTMNDGSDQKHVNPPSKRIRG